MAKIDWKKYAPEVAKADPGKLFEVTFNGGGTLYYIHGDAMAQLLDVWFGGGDRFMVHIQKSSTQEHHTAGYVNHGAGRMSFDPKTVSSISHIEVVQPKTKAKP